LLSSNSYIIILKGISINKDYIKITTK